MAVGKENIVLENGYRHGTIEVTKQNQRERKVEIVIELVIDEFTSVSNLKEEITEIVEKYAI